MSEPSLLTLIHYDRGQAGVQLTDGAHGHLTLSMQTQNGDVEFTTQLHMPPGAALNITAGRHVDSEPDDE